MNNILRMNEKERQALVSYCRQHDVRKAGCFDVRGDENSGAINVWSRSWTTDEDCQLSECVSTIQVRHDRIEIEGTLVGSLAALPVRVVTPLAPELVGVKA